MKLSLPIFHLKRTAKQMSRDQTMPLHQALDAVAKSEGFRSWGHLAASHSSAPHAASILQQMNGGGLVLLAARPEHGKTMLALDILAAAARADRPAFFFTLDYNEEVATRALASREARGVELDTSDDICADHIINALEDSREGTVAAIDYLQLLDQKRIHPPLAEQLTALKAFTRSTGTTLIFLSQIDRSFETSGRTMPGLNDIRLPNPVDISVFDSCWFLHDGHLEGGQTERI